MAHGSSRIPGFYRFAIDRRRRQLAELRELDEQELELFDHGGIDREIADGMIENVVGTYALPLGVGLNFQVNGTDYLVPMAIEEPSVVAAASGAAKLVRMSGGFTASASLPIMIGQVQLVDLADPAAAAASIEAHRDRLLALARELAPRLVARGGGPVDLEVRVLRDPASGASMVIVHLLVDCRDAMGANLVNSLAEGIAGELAALTGARVGLRILSNLCDRRTVTVRCRVSHASLGGAAIAEAIASASRFAELDPYRAATHNKGIMNGIDAVLLATGNDWRGVEAGAHAFACTTGQYRPLATWRSEGEALIGTMTLPLAVGTVGGALHVHPGARLSLALLAVGSAAELATVIAAVGLASNLAALRALATDGIQRGHMSLHARVVARAAGARGDLLEQVAAELARLGDVKTERARQILDSLRASELSSTFTIKEPT